MNWPEADGEIEEQRHPVIRRASDWLFAVAILIMIGSGWRIYNDVPILPFHFPLWATLGGDPNYSYDRHGESGTANALLWHFAGMRLLVASVGLYALHGLLSGYFRRDFLRRVGADTTARYVSYEGADGYYDGMDMPTALHPQTLIATHPRGATLPAKYGYPLKIGLPTKPGFKNPKFVTTLSVTNRRPGGFWVDRGHNWFSGS